MTISTSEPVTTTTRDASRLRGLQGDRLRGLGPLMALVVVGVVFAVLNPSTFPTGDNLLTILDQAAVPLILAMGATFVILMGSIDLSVEGVMAASGLTFVLLTANTTNSNDLGPLAVVIALSLGLAFGLIIGAIHARLRVPSFIVSLGFWYIGLGMATVMYGDAVTQLRDSALTRWISGTPLAVSNSFLVAVVVVVAAHLLARYSTFGRDTYAIGDNEQVASLAHVPISRVKIMVFGFAGLCSGLAGVIGSLRLGAGVVEVGSGQVFFTIAAIVVGGTVLSGGKGGVLYSVVGVLLLTVINNGLVLSGVNPNVQQAFFGLIILAAVLVTGLRRRSILGVVK
ncbi:ABC transporter permease [Streptomyces sp. NPDC021098]|uniref:ABC transporter permease n=1 Tax=unclassified Streptomyces TaxID=2593676 RepID=UPI0037A3F2BF